MHFATPTSFRCNSNVSWRDLSDWGGEQGRCKVGLAYTVIGEVPGVEEGYVATRMILIGQGEEGSNMPSSALQKVINHSFETSLCISRKDIDRQIVMQAYTHDGRKYGWECGLVITRQGTTVAPFANAPARASQTVLHSTVPVGTIGY
jgi:hypothetical protein